MTIHAEIQFDHTENGETKQWLLALDEITIQEIETEIRLGANALIINRFEGKVPLEEMIVSTKQSIEIMGSTSKPIDILAVMERESHLSMAIKDIQKTAEIMDFANHPQRGATIAVMYEKSVAKFFLSIANQLLPNANFVIANSMDEAYHVLEKYRQIRS